MGKLELIDNILAPNDTLNVSFTGRSPFAAAASVEAIVRKVMKLPGKDFFETDVRWDITGKNHEFYGMWMGKREMDRWSKLRVRVLIQGEQDPTEKTGHVSIDIKGTLLTEYNYSNPFQRAFWWFYSHAFYNKQRTAYIEEGKDLAYEIRDKFQELLGISPITQ